MFSLYPIVLLIIVLIDCSLFSFVDLRASSRASSSLTCDKISLRNGYVRYRERKSASRSFTCRPSFKLHGARYSKCVNGRWNEDMPICIKSGCKTVQTLNNGVIDMQNNGASVSLHCMYGYQLVGNREAYCNGTNWDRSLGTCHVTDTATRTECDFEAADLCGWENDLDNSYDWIRRNGFASFNSFVSGPTHDHTTGKPLMGHYMVAEASGTRNSQVARLFSPIYNETMSTNACFRMFSHMYGATVGDLKVYIKPDSLDMATVRNDQRYLLFHKNGNLGNRWVEDFMPVEPIDEDFRIVVEAKPINGIISDIAVDDMALLTGSHCIQFVKNETAVSTEEPNGIYEVMSCVNRCNETISIHNVTKFETDMITGKQVEVCDCHDQCSDLETCCPDYNDICLADSTDVIDTTTESDSTSAATSTPITTTSTSIPTTSTTPTISTILTTSTSSSTTTSTAAPTSTTSSTTTSRPLTSTSTTSTSPTSTKIFNRNREGVPLSTKKSMVSPIKTTRKTITTLKTTAINTTPTRKSQMTETTLPTKNQSHISIIMLSLLIATVLSVVCLVIFLLINKTWKPYNIDAIEFKTKYYANKVEEPLLCSYGDTEQSPTPHTRRESAIATANIDEATVLVDVIATQGVEETNTTATLDATHPKKKPISKTKSKTKSKNNSKRKTTEDVGLLDSDEEHLDFSMQHEVE